MSRREGRNSDESYQGKVKSRERLALEQRRADIREVMASAAGRRFIYNLIFDSCGLMNLYPAQDSGIYRHEGQRTVGFRLATELQMEHTSNYIAMISEHLRDQENERKLADAAATPTSDEKDDQS
jgi:hypothetical protein